MRNGKYVLIGIIMCILIVASFSFFVTKSSGLQGSTGKIPGGGSPGAGGITGMAYRVAIINEKMKAGNEFDFIEPSQTVIKNALVKQFENHFPNFERSIILVPKEEYEGKMGLGWYNSSIGDIEWKGVDKDITAKSKLKNLGSVNKRENLLFYDKIVTLKKEQLQNGGWKKYINIPDVHGESLALWKNIVERNDPIGYLKGLLDESKSLDKDPKIKWQCKMKYLSLLMTVYVLSADTDKTWYYQEIERFIKNENIETNPVLLGIDTVTKVSASNYLGEYKLFIPSIDYMEFCYGGTTKASLRKVNFNAGSAKLNTKELLVASAKQSIRQAPKLKRITDIQSGRINNGFAWGMSGVAGYTMYTNGGNVTIKKVVDNNGRTIVGYMEALVFKDNMYGFVVAGECFNLPEEPTGKFSLIVEPDNKEVKESKINQFVNIKIDLTQTLNEQKKWEKYLASNPQIKLKVELIRQEAGAKISPIGDAPALKEEVITKAKLLSYLAGKSKLTYSDDVTQVSIQPEQKKTYTYTAKVYAIVGTKEKIIFSSTKDKDSASFYRKKPVEKGAYTSKPEYWSEIKQGSPENEQFEAMAGTPTTRNLYFASGGSEFIVNIEVEYVENATSTRTYTSEFHSVECEFAVKHRGPLHNAGLSPITGGWSDSRPSLPTPRRITGYNGQTHTESVSIETQQVQDKPAKYDSKGKEISPATTKTQYRTYQSGLSSCTGCGPCHNHIVGGYKDTWTQTVTFDYMKINKVQVWKLSKSKVDGMEEITGTDEITANIVNGNPTVFSNIAAANDSAHGRLRYSLETNQHDNVYWDEGNSDNSHSNSKTSGAVNEQAKFNERRNMLTNVTVISDFVILQTSSGDQSVLYFETTSASKKTSENIDVPKSSFDLMWTNNPYSAAKWTEDYINIGSYNGNYSTPDNKYSEYKSSDVRTIFDTKPAGLNRPSRPSQAMRLYNSNIDIIDTNRNGEYITGNSSVFYELVLDYGNNFVYSEDYNYKYQAKGQEFSSTYSDYHSKVNDIVIHNPVSSEYACVMPSNLQDQRTKDYSYDENYREEVVEYEKVLVEVPPKEAYYEITKVPNPDYIPLEKLNRQYDYTGSKQSFVAPLKGEYKIKLWGAQGGGTPSTPDVGGKGSYVEGIIKLEKGDALSIYVGGKGGNSPSDSIDGSTSLNSNGGYNGGGNGSGTRGPGGGGGTDIRKGGDSISNKILVAGGGGGSASSNNTNEASKPIGSSNNHYGSDGAYGWYSSSYEYDQGGGGGGYFGGTKVDGDDPSLGYAGTSYYNPSFISKYVFNQGEKEGNGKVMIVPYHIEDNPEFYERKKLVDPGNASTYEYQLIPKIISNKKTIKAENGTTFEPGNCIYLDYKFDIYFPNKGDFYGNGMLGLSSTTPTRGKGFTDNMDTTEWTKEKYVKFDFNVIYNGKMYLSDEMIPLAVNQNTFSFYCSLANKEAKDARVTFISVANNGIAIDNELPTNKIRYDNIAAKHSASKRDYIDIVGRIGNLVIEDTSDYRYSNLFKNPLSSEKWFINNLVKEVNTDSQRDIVGSSVDIRGNAINTNTRYLDTYGYLPHLRKIPIEFPISSEKNNLKVFKNQQMPIGYKVFSDIQTIGDYRTVDVSYYYYSLNLSNGSITPVDVYISDNGNYKSINKYGSGNIEYKYEYNLDWNNERGRRNISQNEEKLSGKVVEYLNFGMGDYSIPCGEKYTLGNADKITIGDRGRTFIGSAFTYGYDKNPGGLIDEILFNQEVQRWHFTYGLPSSAVAVEQGKEVNTTNINKVCSNNTLLVVAAEIKSFGEKYVLEYKIPNGNSSINYKGRTYSLRSIPYNVISIFSSNKSNKNDLLIQGTH